MKRVILIAGFIFCLMGLSAHALTIETKSSHVVLVNGTRIDTNDISQIDYSDSNDTTSIHFLNGKIITFRTSYNDYLQIYQACYPSEGPSASNTSSYTLYYPIYGYNMRDRYSTDPYYIYNHNHNSSSSHGNNNTNNNNGNTNTGVSLTPGTTTIMVQPQTQEPPKSERRYERHLIY